MTDTREGYDRPNSLAARRAALSEVFTTFCTRWPRFFSGERAPSLMPVWLMATSRIDVPLLTTAAVQYAATQSGKYPPEPADFTKFALAMQTRHAGGVATHAPEGDRVFDVYVGAKPFWFDKPGTLRGPGRLDEQRAVAWKLSDNRGCMGITDSELDEIAAGKREFGWLEIRDLPADSIPASFR